MNITPITLKALAIIDEHGPIKPREFARFMWPDSPGWQRASPCGPKGTTHGGGMWKAGGSYMWKLYRAGLVHQDRTILWDNSHYFRGWRLTNKGKAALQEATNDTA